MRRPTCPNRWLAWSFLTLTAGVVVGLSGCQVEMGGQTLPSPYYMKDDVQYFAPGPEFKLAREAAALKAARAEEIPAPPPAEGPLAP